MRIALYSEDHELQILLGQSTQGTCSIHPEFTEEAINRLLETDACEVVFLDLTSKRQSTQLRIEFAKKIILSPVFSVVIADDSLQSAAMALVELGADGFRRKSSYMRELETLARKKSEHNLVKRVVPQSRLTSSDLTYKPVIGTSAAIQHVYELVGRVADLDASVLITGESGTGKELVARSIHAMGGRANRPFVAVSCSAIPESLLEAELFGHEKGAFTGTTGTREGYFEQAGTGTLFLDEIGDLSLHAQVKLLRVLQERSFCRLGSSRPIPLQARVLFATHLNLAEMVRLKSFRGDLYYRINVIRIQTPPLRDHPEDIPELAMYFLERYSREFQRPVRFISPEALDTFRAYSWPGNVRELENVIQRAVVIASGDTICLCDLPIQIHDDKLIDISEPNQGGFLDRYLLDHKIKLAQEALREFRGNKTLAARSLGISRPYLYRLIRIADADQGIEGRAAAEAI